MLAWCGAALSCLLCIPQATRTLRAERLDGVSASTYWIVLASAAVWVAWSLLTGEHAAGAPALVNGPGAVLSLVAARRRRRPTPSAAALSELGRRPPHATTGDRLVLQFRHPQLSQHPVAPTGTQGTTSRL